MLLYPQGHRLDPQKYSSNWVEEFHLIRVIFEDNTPKHTISIPAGD